MTRNDDRLPGAKGTDPQDLRLEGPVTSGAAPSPAPSPGPSWVDEVLSGSSTPSPVRPADPFLTEEFRASGPAPRPEARAENDLRIPEPPRPEGGVQPGLQPSARPPAPPTRPYTDADADDWIARATGGAARTPAFPAEAPTGRAPLSSPDPWDTRVDQRPALTRAPMSGPVPGNIQEKRLIAGLLAIVLGSFGVHKFYLGMNTPGVIMLGVNVGAWVLAVLLGLITFGLGLFITLPLAGLISGALGLLGLIEGILYLTKSDQDFYTQYVLDKKPWL